MIERIRKYQESRFHLFASILTIAVMLGSYLIFRAYEMGEPNKSRPSFAHVLLESEHIKGKSKNEVIELIGKPDRVELSGRSWIYENHDIFNISGSGNLMIGFDPREEKVSIIKYDSSGI